MKAPLLGLMLFALLLFVPRTAPATSCDVPQLGSSLERAMLVFTGRATVREDTGNQTLVDMAVERVFKGSVPRKLRVSGGGLKGAMFTTGKRYLVFARILDAGEVVAHLCGGTQQLPSDWVKRLGAGSAPTSGGAPVAAINDAGAADATPVEPVEPAPAAPEAVAVAPTSNTPEADGPRPAPGPPGVTPPPSGGCGSCGVTSAKGTAAGLPWLILLTALGRRRRGRPFFSTRPRPRSSTAPTA
ncbi:MAG: hypothetical protein IPI67_05360 [Myxococcales bacterium]|nr:hypothetical protein [Myxococcales bacterium]